MFGLKSIFSLRAYIKWRTCNFLNTLTLTLAAYSNKMPEATIFGYKAMPQNFVPLMEHFQFRHLSAEARELIEQLQPIFVAHGVQEKLGVMLIHRHCELGKDEILVQSYSDDGNYSVLSPWKFCGKNGSPIPEALPVFQKLDIAIHDQIIPLTWQFNSDGNLIPFEYLNTFSADEIDEPSPKFTQEFYNFLKTHDKLGIIGLRRITNQTRHHGYENTEPGSRISITKYFGEGNKISEKEESSDYLDVVWDFSSKHGKNKPTCWQCSTSCCSNWDN